MVAAVSHNAVGEIPAMRFSLGQAHEWRWLLLTPAIPLRHSVAGAGRNDRPKLSA